MLSSNFKKSLTPEMQELCEIIEGTKSIPKSRKIELYLSLQNRKISVPKSEYEKHSLFEGIRVILEKGSPTQFNNLIKSFK
jgi:hypothetical protein